MRLAQALGESSHRLLVPAAHLPTFQYLARTFGGAPVAASAQTPVLPGLELDHEFPRTTVGTLERPLIFPRALFDHLRERWHRERPVHFSFSGLAPPKRRAAVSAWVARHQEAMGPPTHRRSLTSRLGDRLEGLRPIVPSTARDPRLRLLASRRGRRFPVKAWDARYYEELCRSRFVLCPDGDFIWTYRFFEAVACGALPLVERSCPHYEGFTYRTLETPLSDLEVSFEALEQNFELARERLTLPREQLDDALEDLLRG